jgi:hypothetical protein
MADTSKGNGYPTELTKEVLEKFEAPFPKIRWRPQSIIKSKKNDKSYGIMMAYIDVRDVIDRLNEVVGPAGWSDHYEQIYVGDTAYIEPAKEDGWKPVPEKKILKKHYVTQGKLTILGITHEDIGYPNSDDDKNPLKSSRSDALKRCAVQFGIGKFLYSLDSKIIEYDPKSKKPVNEDDLKKLENMFQSVGRVANKE